jgi:hypothetical protein
MVGALFAGVIILEKEKETLPSYKELAELLKDGLTPEAQEKIMELRQTVLAIQEENFRLRERIRELEAASAPVREMIYDKGVYWTLEAGVRQGPFCPACHDKSGKVVRLHYCHTGTPGIYWVCKSCHQSW